MQWDACCNNVWSVCIIFTLCHSGIGFHPWICHSGSELLAIPESILGSLAGTGLGVLFRHYFRVFCRWDQAAICWLHFWCFTCKVNRCSRTHFTCEISRTHYIYGHAATLSLRKKWILQEPSMGYHHQVLLYSLHQLERFCNSMLIPLLSFFIDSKVCSIMMTRLSKEKKEVCCTVALPFTLKSIWRHKKNYGNSNISPCKNIIFKKSSKRNHNPSRYYNSKLISSFNTSQKHHLSKILI